MTENPIPTVGIGFFVDYTERIKQLCDQLDFAELSGVAQLLLQARASDQNIYIAGNGGSAATSLHFACDLGQLGTRTARAPFRALSLNQNTALLSASANDHGYEQVFVDQLATLFRPGDILVVISASGDSENLVRAVQWVEGHGGDSVGLLGFDGGRLAQRCSHRVLVSTPNGRYDLVEDLHLVITHMLTSFLHTELMAQ